MNIRALLLASGGLDSTTCWWLLTDRGWHITPLFVHYRQPAAVRELESVLALARLKNSAVERIDLSSQLYAGFPSYGLLPARNLMLLALAIARAGALGIRTVVIGSNADDAARGDGSHEFRYRVALAAAATPPRVRVLAPLASLAKRDVVRCAQSLTAPLQATVSCYTAVAGGCGDCRGCYDRRWAFGLSST